MGCDKAVLINIEDDVEEADQYTASAILYNYLKDREYDIILGGNVAIDGDRDRLRLVWPNCWAFLVLRRLQS